MEKALAKEIMDAASQINDCLNKVTGVIEMIPEDEEKLRYRAAVAGLMADVYLTLMVPIVRLHKDLDPDRSTS